MNRRTEKGHRRRLRETPCVAAVPPARAAPRRLRAPRCLRVLAGAARLCRAEAERGRKNGKDVHFFPFPLVVEVQANQLANFVNSVAQVLQGHKGEVWFLLFSNNGKYLASSSNDKSAIIWEIREDGEVSMKHMLTGHQTPVVMVAWSPDDRQLLSCGVEEVVRRWDVCTGECLHVYRKDSLGLISCSWFPDGKQIFSGITDKSICVWGLDGEVAECWKGQRTMKTSDAAITKDGRRIISICRNTAILLLDRETEVEKLIEEDEPITSFSLSRDGFFLLMNLGNEEIQLWNIVDEPYLVTKYKGHKRSRFVIRSCFGGLNEAFIASGSEDSQVYIWQRKTGDLIQRLPGHSGAVSCVSWNPVNPHMLASGSDDHTIRVWGLSRGSLKRKEIHSNGVSPTSETKSN